MSAQIIVLAHAHDRGAAAVAQTLAARSSGSRVAVVYPETLALARWSHTVDATGHASTRVMLPCGKLLDSESTRCLVNRIEHLPNARFARATPKDRDYAAGELNALVTSWISSLGSRAINPLRARGPVKQISSVRGWLAAAAACGLPVYRSFAATAGKLIRAPARGELMRTRGRWPGGNSQLPVEVLIDEAHARPAGEVLVAGDHTSGPMAREFGGACVKMARRLQYSLLEFRFASVCERMQLIGVSPRPALLESSAVDAVAGLVEQLALDAGAHA